MHTEQICGRIALPMTATASLAGVLLYLLASTALASPAQAAINLDANAPAYSSNTIVNAATQRPNGFAPYTIATIYGTNLAFTTRAVVATDVSGGVMPVNLDGVEVYAARLRCPLFFVSPNQINFLIPAELTKGTIEVQVARNAVNGPVATIHLDDHAPGFFALATGIDAANTAIATHADGSLVTADSAAAPKEVIVFYLVGLGETVPYPSSGRIPVRAAPLSKGSGFELVLDGATVSPDDVLYAGLTPGCAGLYQINLRLPANASSSPSVFARFGDSTSPVVTIPAVR